MSVMFFDNSENVLKFFMWCDIVFMSNELPVVELLIISTIVVSLKTQSCTESHFACYPFVL